eukprot:m51a1_g8804 putative trna mitochondrial (801) ;mRNA; r:274744-277497
MADRAIAEVRARGHVPVVVGGTHYYVEALVFRRLVPDAPEEGDGDVVVVGDDVASEMPPVTPEEAYAELVRVDPARAAALHPRDVRKVLRSLRVWRATGVRHSDVIARQQQGEAEGGSGAACYEALFLWPACEEAGVLDGRLDGRVDAMVACGAVAEVAALRAAWEAAGRPPARPADFERGALQSIGVRELWEAAGLLLQRQQRSAAAAAASRVAPEQQSTAAAGAAPLERQQSTAAEGAPAEGPQQGEQQGEREAEAVAEGVAAMKAHTRRYARQQQRWIRHRLCARGRVLPLPWRCTGDAEWRSAVLPAALDAVRAFLAGREPAGLASRPSPSASAGEGSEGSGSRVERHECAVCGKVMFGSSAWGAHVLHCYETSFRLPEEDFALAETDDGGGDGDGGAAEEAAGAAGDGATPRKKRGRAGGRSEATDKPRRKRRRRKGAAGSSEPDSEYESSGEDAYDLGDPFVDARSDSEIGSDDEGYEEMLAAREARLFVGGDGPLRQRRRPDFRGVADAADEYDGGEDPDDEDWHAKYDDGDDDDDDDYRVPRPAHASRTPRQQQSPHRAVQRDQRAQRAPRAPRSPEAAPLILRRPQSSAAGTAPRAAQTATAAAPTAKAAVEPLRAEDDGVATDGMADEDLVQQLSNVVPRCDAEAAAREWRSPRQRHVTDAVAGPQRRPAAETREQEEGARLLGVEGPVRKLPEFMRGVRVLVFGELDVEQRLLERYVRAYGGGVDEGLGEQTTHVVTSMPWDAVLEDAVESHPRLRVVRPSWVLACHREQRLVDPEGPHSARSGCASSD